MADWYTTDEAKRDHQVPKGERASRYGTQRVVTSQTASQGITLRASMLGGYAEAKATAAQGTAPKPMASAAAPVAAPAGVLRALLSGSNAAPTFPRKVGLESSKVSSLNLGRGSPEEILESSTLSCLNLGRGSSQENLGSRAFGSSLSGGGPAHLSQVMQAKSKQVTTPSFKSYPGGSPPPGATKARSKSPPVKAMPSSQPPPAKPSGPHPPSHAPPPWRSSAARLATAEEPKSESSASTLATGKRPASAQAASRSPARPKR